jgi:hypothetical protein
MTSTQRITKAGPISRTISVSFALAGRCEVCVRETKVGLTTTDTYLLSRQPSHIGGVAFQVKKCDGESYDVLLNQPGGGHSCTCKWGSYKAHIKNCRHMDLCIQALRERKI